MRSDFIGDCEVFQDLPQAVSDSQFLVPRMNRRQMQEVIENPLLLFGCQAAPDLVNQVLNDAGTAPDQLPLMQHALMRTWFVAQGRMSGLNEPKVLSLGDYNRVGRFSSALSQHLEEAWRSLAGEREQRIAQQLFLCLSDQTEEGTLIRRMAKLGEVAAVANADPSDVIKIVRVFQQDERNFIMASPEGELSAESVLDISHEALLRQWERLESWLKDEKKSVEYYLALARRASDWTAGGADPMRGRELGRLLEWKHERNPTAAWADRYHPGFTVAMRYLEASQQLEVEMTRRSRLVWRTIRVGVAVVGAVLICFAAWATWESHRARMARDEANDERNTARKAATEANKQRDLARKALERSQMADARRCISPIGHNWSLTSQEVDALWEIASFDQPMFRRRIVESALREEKTARQLVNRMDVLAQALTGLNEENRKTVLATALESIKKPDANPFVKLTGARLCGHSAGRDEADIEQVAAALMATMNTDNVKKDADKRSMLGTSLGNLIKRLPKNRVPDMANKVLEAMEATPTDAKTLVPLGMAHQGDRKAGPTNMRG